MQFSDATNLDGIVEEIDFEVDTDSTSYPLKDKARNVNRHYVHVVALILQSDGRWQWDDTNQTDLPIGVGTLVNNQQDYAITGATYLTVTRAEVKDINGNYQVLNPLDQHDIQGQALTEFQKTAGMPRYYDKIGDSIFLYPKPSTSLVTPSEGLKVYFQRGPSYFVSTDTTKKAGFAALFHRILSVGGAMDYARANSMTTKYKELKAEYRDWESQIVTFYSARSRDEQVHARTRQENYGAEADGYERRGQSDKVAF